MFRLLIFTSMENSISNIVWYWMKSLDIKLSKSLLTQELESHPDYPSALSITDILDDLGIETVVLEIEKENLNKIPIPFLAHTHEGIRFKLINDIALIADPASEFYKQWTGVVIATERPKEFKNIAHENALGKEKKNIFLWSGLFSVILIISFIKVSLSFSVLSTILITTNILGLFIAGLIVIKEIGKSNDFADSFCGANNEDCGSVIQSQSGKLISWLSWADIGIVFFVSQWTILLIAANGNTTDGIFPLLKLISISSLIFVIFSLYYQWKIAKKWCTLCLITVSILILQSFAFFFLQKGWLENLNISGSMIVILSFALIGIVWLLFSPIMKESKESKIELKKLLKFKNNPDIFIALLRLQRQVDITPFKNEFELANPNALIKITVACNPYCLPCAKAHNIFDFLAKKYFENISLTIRFTITASNKEDRITKALEYLLQLNSIGDNTRTSKMLLHEWFKSMDYENFRKSFPLNYNVNVEDELLEHSTWTSLSNISFTPTIFLNGYEVPKQYSVPDMDILIRGLLNAETDILNYEEVLLAEEIKN